MGRNSGVESMKEDDDDKSKKRKSRQPFPPGVIISSATDATGAARSTLAQPETRVFRREHFGTSRE